MARDLRLGSRCERYVEALEVLEMSEVLPD